MQRKAAFTTKESCHHLQVYKCGEVTDTSLAKQSISVQRALAEAYKPFKSHLPAKTITQWHMNINTFRSVTVFQDRAQTEGNIPEKKHLCTLLASASSIAVLINLHLPVCKAQSARTHSELHLGYQRQHSPQ